MKKTIVYLRAWCYDVQTIGDEVTLSGRWKTVITNNTYELQFEDNKGNWYADYDLIVITKEEFLNECSNY